MSVAPPNRMRAQARYGIVAKVPQLRQLTEARRAAILVWLTRFRMTLNQGHRTAVSGLQTGKGGIQTCSIAVRPPRGCPVDMRFRHGWVGLLYPIIVVIWYN